ncbi:alpha/beta fold hydrolase [Rhizobium sp. AP16]|uniref:alpha/beta fold hydrolase n=1 Tax=Rhizobium sp. AP16 TaxID=1144306 RepID=UPI00026EE80A|nr:alpha/beta hydrolase [Rhizobium sp. AP16]EJK87897.1 putative hydrolase or acyltransferase of alpha/beta superfamily [Rhizobium sp. AP16]
MSQFHSYQLAVTPILDIAFEEGGPRDGFPLILVHGWPDDVRTWDRIVPQLQSAGFRTLVPYLRGVGPTRFRDPDVMRSGQLSALGRDVLDFAEALGLGRFGVIGHDWGARAAYIAACLAPGRVACCVAMSVGWGTNNPDQPLSLRQSQNYWYHWLMALPRGEALVRNDRLAFTRYIWTIWNPDWAVPDEEFDATATSFGNPDWADVVLHSYRVRWDLADPDPSYAALEDRLKADPIIHVPTLVLHGGSDPCNDVSTSDGKDEFFRAPYQRVVLPGLGHFPHREEPGAVLKHMMRFLSLQRR